MIVSVEKQGSALGVLTVCNNIGDLILPPIIGYIHDKTKNDNKHGYFWVAIFSLTLSSIAFLLLIMIELV